MASPSIVSPTFIKLIENTAAFAMQVYIGAADTRCVYMFITVSLMSDVIASLSTALESTSQDLPSGTYKNSPDSLDTVDRANALTAEFEKTRDIQHSNQAIFILESFLNRVPDNDPDRHYILFNLALTHCRRVEIQMTEISIETLVDLHRALTRSFFLLWQAVNISPAAFEVKIQYLGQLGHTATLWSTILNSRWPAGDVLALLARLKEERDTPSDPAAEKITGIVAAIVMASTQSTAFGVTQNPVYRKEGREMYRHTLK